MNRLCQCALVLISGLALRAFAQPPGEISIESYTFDPARGAPALAADLLAPEPAAGVLHWRILQFSRPLDRATQETLSSMGLTLERYIEGDAYLERVTRETVQRLQDAGLLRASILYHPAFKLSSTIGQLRFRTPGRTLYFVHPRH